MLLGTRARLATVLPVARKLRTSPEKQAFARRYVAALTAAKKRPADIHRETRIDQGTLSRYKRGLLVPLWDTATVLAAALGTTPEHLLGRTRSAADLDEFVGETPMAGEDAAFLEMARALSVPRVAVAFQVYQGLWQGWINGKRERRRLDELAARETARRAADG